MDNSRMRAAIRVRLGHGQDEPALDAQLAEGLRATAEQSLSVAGVVGAIEGPLGVARCGQLSRLLEQLRVSELPAALVFHGTAPPDLSFLGQQARRHGFAIAVAPERITIATPGAFAAPE